MTVGALNCQRYAARQVSGQNGERAKALIRNPDNTEQRRVDIVGDEQTELSVKANVAASGPAPIASPVKSPGYRRSATGNGARVRETIDKRNRIL